MNSRNLIRTIFLGLLVALSTGNATAQQEVPQSQAQVQLSFAPVVRTAAPSVVNVYATRIDQQQFNPMFSDPFFQRFFGDNSPFYRGRPRESQSLGSGVIVAEDGVIITNYHVVDGADDIRVSLTDGREFGVQEVLADEDSDLAVLKIIGAEGEPFPTLAFADSDQLQVGDLVLAIGNPFGVGQTVTSGIVSALARTGVGASDFDYFIQTDAAINPGNSGGALVNMNGELVGINSAIFSRSGGSNGIGFAIPANLVRLVADAAIHGDGEVVRPWFGASFASVHSEQARQMGVSQPFGALVTGVEPDSPAQQAGIRPGDVITRVDDVRIDNPDAFSFRFATRQVGDRAHIVFIRGDQQESVEIALVARPEPDPARTISIGGRGPFSGLALTEINQASAAELNIDPDTEGVAVLGVEPNTRAARAGFQPGDVFIEVNGTKTDNLEAMTSAISVRTMLWRLTLQRGNRIIRTVLSG